MAAAKQLDGQTFGRLLVLCRNGTRGGRVLWDCRCICGTAVLAVSHALTSGHTKSCGCWRDERNASTPHIHGHAMRGRLSRTYKTWQAMMARCYNSSAKSFADYGARGITVCPAWHKFEGFLASMGERPEDTTLDRSNNLGNYEPENCRWATRTEQNRNTRANKLVHFEGTVMTQAEFAERVGLKQGTVSYRLRAGWTPEQVASTPPHTGNRVAAHKLGEEVEIPKDLLP